MDFAVATPRKVETGQFATISSGERPLAQVFVPECPPVPEQFSFFWCAAPKRSHVSTLLKTLLRGESEVKIRLIGRSYVTTFGFSRAGTPKQHPEVWNFDLVYRLINGADLPYSVGVTVDTSTVRDWVSEVYVWASVAADVEGGPVQGKPEAGVRTTLHDWHKPAFRQAIFPLFASTIGLKEGASDLWSQAAKTARNLMPVAPAA